MKSAGERRDRSSDPNRNAINAAMIIVESEYCLGEDVRVADIEPKSRSFSPPGGIF
jgi:hypothetical protein